MLSDVTVRKFAINNNMIGVNPITVIKKVSVVMRTVCQSVSFSRVISDTSLKIVKATTSTPLE